LFILQGVLSGHVIQVGQSQIVVVNRPEIIGTVLGIGAKRFKNFFCLPDAKVEVRDCRDEPSASGCVGFFGCLDVLFASIASR